VIYFHEFSRFVSSFSKFIDHIIYKNNLLDILRIISSDDINKSMHSFYSELKPLPYKDYPGNSIYLESAFRNKENMSGKKTAILYFSRGCAYECTFCINPAFYERKVFFRDVSSLFSEIEYFYSNGINHFSFEDSDFLINHEAIESLKKMLEIKNMAIHFRAHARADSININWLKMLKKMGCERLDIGLESGSDIMLEKIKKGITSKKVLDAALLTKKNGIRPYILVIIGIPGETKSQLKETDNMLEYLRNERIEFGISYYRLMPGSEEFQRLSSKHIFDSISSLDKKWNFSDGIDNVEYDDFYFKYQKKRLFSKDLTLKIHELKMPLIIKVSDYSNGEFNPIPLNYWNGDEWCNKGYSHLVGRFRGYVSYEFLLDNTLKTKKITVSFYASTQTENEGQALIELNGIIKTVRLPLKSVSGEKIVIEFKDLILRRKNILRFIIDGPEGLSLFGNNIEEKEEGHQLKIDINF